MSRQHSPAAPYEALAEIIDRELALVPSRDFEAIDALKRERGAIVKRLPATPPPEARAALERCQILQETIVAEWQHVGNQLIKQLRQVRHAQRAAAGYSPAPSRPRPRVSTSA